MKFQVKGTLHIILHGVRLSIIVAVTSAKFTFFDTHPGLIFFLKEAFVPSTVLS